MSKEKIQSYNLFNRWSNDEKIISAPPVDLSYQKATNISDLRFRDLTNKIPRFVRTGRIPQRSSNNRFLSCSLWLSNNNLVSLDQLDVLVKKVLENPDKLSWLDVSYNQIMEIPKNLVEFPNLQILYLHGNKIYSISNILKLKHLSKLRTLTLHGNPVEAMPNYRAYIVAILPQILHLDFSPILGIERKRALPTGFFKTLNAHI